MIVAVGDSITAGQYCERAWPSLVEGFDIVNKGTNGNTTRLMLERFPNDVQSLHPSVVIIQAGHNDCNRWMTDRGLNRVSKAAFRANLEEMIERVRTFNAKPIMVTMVPSRRDDRFQADSDAYNAILTEVAWANDVQTVDVRGVFREERDWADRLLLSDGLHLSQRGHGVFAATVQKVLVGALVAA